MISLNEAEEVEGVIDAHMRRLAAFTRFNPNPVLGMTESGELTYCNDAALRLAEALQKPTPLELLPANVSGAVSQCLATGVTVDRLETHLGSRRFFWSLVPVKADQMVHCYGYELIAVPATPIPIENTDPSITECVEDIAHDFNNLLTLIQVNASTLLSEKTLDKELAESAEQIYRAVDRAANLTGKLYAFRRSD